VSRVLGARGARQQNAFDQWHETSCSELCELFQSQGYGAFRIGQAQKWLNMTIKYALSLAEIGVLEVPAVSPLRVVAHVPIDNIIIEALDRCKNLPPRPRFKGSWSRIADYEVYRTQQLWVRKAFPKNAPLDVEFHLWNAENARRRAPSV
jgi:hypothetical protein